MSKPEPHAAAWYVIEAQEAGGDKAQLSLAVAGLNIWRPFDVKRDPMRGKDGRPRRDIRTPRFGRYFFVRCAMTDALQDAIRHTTGVAEILCSCGTDDPYPIPEGQIEWLKANPVHDAPANPLPAVKDRVRVKEGPFASHEGFVRAVDKRGVIRVELELFGRLVPIVIEAGHVEITLLAKSRAISTYKRRAA